MKFKIMESGFYHKTKKISPEYAKQLLRTQFNEAKKSAPIYRGFYWEEDNDEKKYVMVSPDPKTPRQSANTTNHYTNIINNSPAWNNFPKREIICTTDPWVADAFGQVYRVYPKNGAKIGICPNIDIWHEDFDGKNTFIDMLFYVYLDIEPGSSNPLEDFLQDCAALDKKKGIITWDNFKVKKFMGWTKKYFEKYWDNFQRGYLNNNVSFWEYLGNNFYAPKNFSWGSIKMFRVRKGREVWTDAPCLMEYIL